MGPVVGTENNWAKRKAILIPTAKPSLESIGQQQLSLFSGRRPLPLELLEHRFLYLNVIIQAVWDINCQSLIGKRDNSIDVCGADMKQKKLSKDLDRSD